MAGHGHPTRPDRPDRPDRTLDLPYRVLGRTVAAVGDALVPLAPGAVLAVRTDDP